MGTLSGETTPLFLLLPPVSTEVNSWRIWSYWSKFFPLRVDFILEGLHDFGKQAGNKQETWKFQENQVFQQLQQ